MKLNLSKEQILNKKFTPSFKGYDSEAVDKFLDLILEDYLNFEIKTKEDEQLISSLRLENEEYKNRIQAMKDSQEFQRLKKEAQSAAPEGDNLELLKRCAIYEKKLYQMGVDPSKLK